MSSQAEHGWGWGGVGSCRPAWLHEYAWNPGILELCPPLTELSVAAFLLRAARCCYHTAAAAAATAAAAAEALHAVALPARLLRAVIFSLLAPALGK